MERFIRQKVALGEYETASEVVREALRVLEGLELEPARHWFRVKGTYDFKNHREFAIPQVPLTAGDHWENVRWTMNGEDYTRTSRTPDQAYRPETGLPNLIEA